MNNFLEQLNRMLKATCGERATNYEYVGFINNKEVITINDKQFKIEIEEREFPNYNGLVITVHEQLKKGSSVYCKSYKAMFTNKYPNEEEITTYEIIEDTLNWLMELND